MQENRRRLPRCTLAGAVICLMLGVSGRAAAPVDVQALTQELQSFSPSSDRIGFVWWTPAEFWRAAIALDPTTTAEQADNLAGVLKPYLILGIADGTIGPMGGFNFFAEEQVLASVRVRDAAGTVYSPLAKEKVSADARNMMAMMRTILTGAAGSMGENIHFVFFAGDTAEGRPIADPSVEGSFTVVLGEEEHSFRLPVASLIPKKVCPIDGEELNGTWNFCPWHGAKLEAATVPAATAPEPPPAPPEAEAPPPGG